MLLGAAWCVLIAGAGCWFSYCNSSHAGIVILEEDDGDLDEPEYAKYLEEEILDMSGDLIRASWQSGVGAVPLGFTTYATNAIESTWRILKGLFDKGFRYQNVCQLIIKVHRAIISRVKAGKYADLQNTIEHPPAWLLYHAGTRKDGDDELRIDGKFIREHWIKHKAAGTFLEAACEIEVAMGFKAVKVNMGKKQQIFFL